MKTLITMAGVVLGFAAINADAEGTQSESHQYQHTQQPQVQQEAPSSTTDERLVSGLTFEKLDANDNGVIEESEALAMDDKEFEDGMEVEFEELDKNDDSEVSRREWRDYFAQM